MPAQHFLLTDEAQITAAEDHLAEIDAFRSAREDFAAEYGACAYKDFGVLAGAMPGKLTKLSVVGLKFEDGAVPDGFVASPAHGGYAIPDPASARGREIATQMASLPQRPLPTELCRMLGVDNPLMVVE
jgi:hypothetical protein